MYVWDARNGNVQGPFAPGDAENLAADLNKFVAGGMGLPREFLAAAEIRGPFYVRDTAFVRSLRTRRP